MEQQSMRHITIKNSKIMYQKEDGDGHGSELSLIIFKIK